MALLGFHGTPLWRGDAVYLPAYPPLYDRSGPLLGGRARASPGARPGVWVPLALHLPWEADDGWATSSGWRPSWPRYAAPWGDFLDGRGRVARGRRAGVLTASRGSAPRGGERRSRMLRATTRSPPPRGSLQPHEQRSFSGKLLPVVEKRAGSTTLRPPLPAMLLLTSARLSAFAFSPLLTG